MDHKIVLFFSSMILGIFALGIIIAMYMNNKKSKHSPSTSPSKRPLLSISPDDTSQNFAFENSQRATENLTRQLSQSSSMSPYVTDRSYML